MFDRTLKSKCTSTNTCGDKGIVQWYTEGHPFQGGHYKNRGCGLRLLRPECENTGAVEIEVFGE